MEAQKLYQSNNSFISSVGRLFNGIESIKSGENLKENNIRVYGFIEVINIMKKEKLFFTGYGISSSSVLFYSLYNDRRDFSILVSILFWYGIGGIILFCFFLLKSLQYYYHNHFDFFVVLLPFTISSFINSAEGFVMYQILIIGIMTYYKNNLLLLNKFNDLLS